VTASGGRPLRVPQVRRLIRTLGGAGFCLAGLLTACAPTPEDIRVSPDDTWTWQVNQNYQRLAHCLADALNAAPVHSWFFQAPRPITSFEQQWQRNQIVLRSIDPVGVEQVRIQVTGLAERGARVVAVAKNLQRLGGGFPMYYVRAYVDFCAAK
jgi:hypothetical protein